MNMAKENSLQHKAAWVFSVILHPLWFPSVLLVLLFSLPSYVHLLPGEIKRFDLLIVSINTLFIPVAYIIIFYRLKIIRSFQLETREERNLPLILYVVFSYVSFVVLKKVHQPSLVWQILLVSSTITFFCLLVNFRWKISLHMAGIGGFSGMLLIFTLRAGPVFSWWWIVSLLLSGILGTSRLMMKQHTPSEVYTGFFTGFFLAALLLWYMA
ncbi:MAG: phosphatase PAP2 family protein [Chlorobi bacterium]|nr:phosphatase PAP2 family protein [Chlorobiota bacterium]